MLTLDFLNSNELTMKIKTTKILQFFLILLFIFFKNEFLHSQEELANLTYYNLYDKQTGIENKELNNGRHYIKTYRTIKGTHPFFKTTNFTNGVVKYKGQVYGANVKYDLFNDLLIIKHIDTKSAFSLSLNSKLVSSFEIGGHKFVRLPNNEVIDYYYGNGFFEKAYEKAKFTFYIKHKKTQTKISKYNTLRYLFKENKVFFLKHKEEFYLIRGKKDLKKIFPLYKNEIKTFFKNNKKLDETNYSLLFSKIDN